MSGRYSGPLASGLRVKGKGFELTDTNLKKSPSCPSKLESSAVMYPSFGSTPAFTTVPPKHKVSRKAVNIARSLGEQALPSNNADKGQREGGRSRLPLLARRARYTNLEETAHIIMHRARYRFPRDGLCNGAPWTVKCPKQTATVIREMRGSREPSPTGDIWKAF